MRIEFFVPGIPRPGGSKKAFAHPKTGKIMVIDAGGKHTKDWRAVVALTAVQAMEGKPLMSSALETNMIFLFPRPKSHYRTGKFSDQLKPDAPYYKTSMPDLLKITRSTEDAMKGVVYVDDSLIVQECLTKVYTNEKPGAWIVVETI